MQLQPIEGSSTVRAAGFENGVITVLYHSGHWQNFEATEALFEEFLAAPSKGKFVHARLKRGPLSVVPGGKMDSLDTFDFDVCCSKRLSKAIETLVDATEWTCPKCGVDWRPTPTVIGRHWKPTTWTVRIR